MLNMQIDNQTMRSFPVIFGPRKAFNFVERMHRLEDISNNNEEAPAVAKKDTPPIYFIQAYLDHMLTTEGKI